MPDFDPLLAGASALPLDARIELIEALWDTVPDDAMRPLSDEWRAEIQRRSAEYDSGQAVPIPWAENRTHALGLMRLSLVGENPSGEKIQ